MLIVALFIGATLLISCKIILDAKGSKEPQESQESKEGTRKRTNKGMLLEFGHLWNGERERERETDRERERDRESPMEATISKAMARMTDCVPMMLLATLS